MQKRLMTWLVLAMGLVLIGFSFPVDGLAGAALALVGIAFEAAALRMVRTGSLQ